MPTINFTTPLRNAMAQSIATALDAGPAAGTLAFYDGTQPASANDAITTQTKLGTLTLSDPSGTVDAGILTFAPITQDSAADATGTATWARLFDSTGAAVCDLDVTNEAGSGAIKLNTVAIGAGGPILMNSLVITVG